MNAVVKHEHKAVAVANSEPALLNMIERMASDPNVDVDKFERFVALRDRERGWQAEQAFNEAMRDAQAEMGRVAADKRNDQTKSDYASYAALDRMVRPIYTAHGFALSFDTEAAPTPDAIVVKCYVSHSAGFTRTYRIAMPADGKGAKGGDVMTKTHAVGSATMYGQRYLLKQIFNIAIGVDRDDDDGNGVSGDDHSDWLEAIKGCATLDDLKARKAEMVERFKGVTNVPRNLTAAYNERMNALRATK